MDLETLRITVDLLINSIRPIAERNPNQHTQKDDFERILDIAKEHFYDNELIRTMDSGTGSSIMAIDLLQKLSIIKSALEGKEETSEEEKPEWEEPEE
jgi:hypothetical protein